MASNYLDFYTGEGHLRQKGAMGSSTAYNPGGFQIGTPQGLYWQAGNTQKVVHDTLNNKYYGEQSKSQLTTGLEDSIARLTSQLERGGRNSWQQGWFGNSGSMQFNKFNSKQIADINSQITSQKNYLNNMHRYTQENNQFFDSYEDHTAGWNNVFKGRYDNNVMTERNKQTVARNEKITARNNAYAGQDNGLTIGNGSKAVRARTTPNKNVSTGIQSKADKLTTSLGIGRSGLGI